MKWLIGGLIVGALIAGLLAYSQTRATRECDGGLVSFSGTGSPGPSSGERDPAAAAAWVLEDTDHIVSDPETPSDADRTVRYYSYEGRDLREIVEVTRGANDRWTAGRVTTCQ